MRHIFIIIFISVTLIGSTLIAGPDVNIKSSSTNSIRDGGESGTITFGPGSHPGGPETVDLVGDTLIVGTTWWDQQQIGSVGRMIAVDERHHVHLTWTKGLGASDLATHIFYNAVTASGQCLRPGGKAIEHEQFGRSANLDLLDGSMPVVSLDLFPWGWDRVQTATAVLQPSGLVITQPVYLAELETVWPRMQIDRSGRVHLFATDPGVNGDPLTHLFTCGEYNPTTGGIDYPLPAETWTELSHSWTPARAVATSNESDRVAFGWTRCKDWYSWPPGGPDHPLDSDIFLLIDDDGLNIDPEEFFNLSQFRTPDPAYLPDTVMANMDTLRAANDIDLLLAPYYGAQDDFLHAFFTTRLYYGLTDETHPNASLLWHWSEQFPGEFQLLHNGTYAMDWNEVDCGYLNLQVQRPCAGYDPETGYIYCVYQVFDCDTSHLSQGGYPSGDIYVTVSTDGGQTWAVGTNITETVTQGGAPPGECYSEMHPSLAKIVDGYLHISYILDRDAGCSLHNEGEWTENEVVYHKVPVDEIPQTPLVPQDVPFHGQYGWPVQLHSAAGAETAADFHLSVAPNPFNPVTEVSFELQAASRVKLEVYNIEGRRVRVLHEAPLQPGRHTIPFDGSGLPSGMYFYRLQAGEQQAVGKMLLLK